MPKERQRRFQMDTKAFVAIWRNINEHHTGDDAWKKMVLACFKTFAGRDEFSNMETLQEHDKNWKKWDDDQRYKYLNDKVYSKCIGIQRTMRKKHNYEVSLPNGYLTRGGGKSGRTTSEDILNIFMGK